MAGARPPHIDIHSHVIPAAFVEAARRDPDRFATHIEDDAQGRAWVVQPTGRRIQVRPNLVDQELRMREMDAVQIDVMVESLLPPVAPYWEPVAQAAEFCRVVNDAIAADAARYPDRIVGMGVVPLQNVGEAIREMDRVVLNLGMPSVFIKPVVNGKNLDEPEFFPFFERAQELGVLVYVHPDVPERDLLGRYYLNNLIGNPLYTSIAIASLVFGGVVERLPDLKLCFAHAGGYAPWIRGRWTQGQQNRPEPNVVTRTPFDEQFARLYVDSLIFTPAAMEFLIRTVGPDHVLLGTDYPADMGNWQQVPIIQGFDFLSQAEKDAVLGGNAARLLRLEQRFAVG